VADTTNYAVGAKGDLLAGTAADTVAALAVGNDGETLVADSSTAVGLSYQANFAAGKNKIINGDFGINQRAFTSTTTNLTYGFDRWLVTLGGGTVTYSSEAFTPGAAPVAGYEATNFARLVTTSQSATSDRALLQQRIENVRTFAGQTVTVSFWAKAGSGTPNISVDMNQHFGSGGSPSSTITGIGATKFAINSSWVRYSKVISVPSISGKTIGTTANSSRLEINIWASAGSDFNSRTDSLGNQNITLDIWGVQVENGTVATAFQTATGTIQGELAACQRYYYRANSLTPYGSVTGYGAAYATNACEQPMILPVTMRTTSTTIDYSGIIVFDPTSSYANPSSIIGNSPSSDLVQIRVTFPTGVLTQFRVTQLAGNNNAAAYLGISAEL
jgi:hypothetical protein